MSRLKHTDGTRSTIAAPRFGRRPVDKSESFAERFRSLTLVLSIFAILAVATISLRLVIWLLTFH